MFVSTLGLGQPYQQQLAQAVGKERLWQAELSELNEEQLAQIEVLFSYGYDLPEERLRKMKGLRWLHIGQSGMDKLPMKAIEEMGILLTNSRGINAVAIAEYAMSMMLNVTRKNYVFYEAAKRGDWDVETHLDELYGKAVGILGLGNVGSELAKRAAAFQMRVLGMDAVKTLCDHVETVYPPSQLQHLLRLCDFVVVCMPLTQETHHLLSAAAFREMRPTAWLINVGRGPIVDEEALHKALLEKQIAGAVLDVFETEPLPPSSPLWSMENVYITPHIAGDHLASYMPRMMAILCQNVAAYPERERMVNKVDASRGF